MDQSFADALAEWTGYFTLLGGAGATLLGLQFVAISLRLSIFRQQAVEDVRDFAAFTFGTFLLAIAIAALALAPHETRRSLSAAVFIIGCAGLLGIVWVGRAWSRLNRRPAAQGPASTETSSAGVAALLIAGGAYLVLIVTAILLWRERDAALGLLAIADAVLLGVATVAAWVLLSHAGNDSAGG